MYPLGFVTLANDAVRFSKRGFAGFPYKAFPAVKLGRLGVSLGFQRRGIGGVLLSMTAEFLRTENRTGCRFLTLDAYNKPETLAFYMKNGFDFLQEKDRNTNRRTIPMYRDIMP